MDCHQVLYEFSSRAFPHITQHPPDHTVIYPDFLTPSDAIPFALDTLGQMA